jgi:hypothetical protein
LVHVSALPFAIEGLDAPRSVSFYAESIQPGTPTRLWQAAAGRRMLFTVLLSATDRLTLFAGQPDAADASRFTLSYSLNGRDGTLDGRLRQNGQVDLVPRAGTMGVVNGNDIWDPPR